MGSSSTAVQTAPFQAAPQGAGDGNGGQGNEAGQDSFSMSIIPDGSATAKQSKAKSAGAGEPAQQGPKTVFEGGDPNEGAAGEGQQPQGQQPSKSEQNAENKSQRQNQAGWQQMTEALNKINERLDKFEQGQQQPEGQQQQGKQEQGQQQGAQDNEAMNKLAEALAATNARLERMDFENDPANADLRSAELAAEWKKINSDPKFKDFSLQERADHARGRAGKSQGDAMRDQLSRAEGSMPRGSGGGAPPFAGNPNVTEEDVAVGQAFGFTRKDLEEELS